MVAPWPAALPRAAASLAASPVVATVEHAAEVVLLVALPAVAPMVISSTDATTVAPDEVIPDDTCVMAASDAEGTVAQSRHFWMEKAPPLPVAT